MKRLVRKMSQAGQTALLVAMLSHALSVTSAYATTDKYYVPPTQFSVAFQVMDLGFSNIFGMFQNATGAFSYDTDTKSLSNLRIAVDASSMVVPNKSADNDLRKLFTVREFPELTFMATAPVEFKDNKAEFKGTLKIHGQSKPATFEGTINSIGNSRNGGDATIGLSLRGTFKRADFGMGDEPEIPGRFGETITLLLEAQALKQ